MYLINDNKKEIQLRWKKCVPIIPAKKTCEWLLVYIMFSNNNSNIHIFNLKFGELHLNPPSVAIW